MNAYLKILLICMFFAAAGCTSAEASGTGGYTEDLIYITVDNTTLTAKLADNASSRAFKKLLEDRGAVTVRMHDFGGFEKVGPLGMTLPRSDTQITTETGDIILYQGNQITIYYDVNSWSFTRLGRIQNITQAQLKAILGYGDVEVVFSLTKRG